MKGGGRGYEGRRLGYEGAGDMKGGGRRYEGRRLGI